MKKRIIGMFTIFVILFASLSLISHLSSQKVLAQASCPEYINPDSLECLDYLRNQLGSLQNQQGNIQKLLKDEEYQQLSLQDKITYINNLIAQTEQKIKSLQIEIAATDVEIRLFQQEITRNEDIVSILKQEINTLSTSVNERITESYKYSFINQFELFLDIKNFSSVLRKSKYLATTRNNDKKALEQYTNTVSELELVEAELEDNKAQLELKRASREEEKSELGETINTLDSQKKERERLLAESKIKEAQLLAVYQQNIKKLSDLDRAIINYINTHESEIVDSGYVTTNVPIGRMGNTGLSNGSHLHFGLNSGTKYSGWGYFYSDINLFSNGYLRKAGNSFLYWPSDNWYSPIIVAGSARNPLSGNYILMTQTEHQGNAIDLVSYSRNEWGYKNEGAPVYPILPGQLYKGVDGYGGKYAYIKHGSAYGGMVSVYLHLQ